MFEKPSLLIEQISLKERIVNFICLFKISSYNYIASVFEPIIEKSSINIEYLKNTNDEEVMRRAWNINIITWI